MVTINQQLAEKYDMKFFLGNHFNRFDECALGLYKNINVSLHYGISPLKKRTVLNILKVYANLNDVNQSLELENQIRAACNKISAIEIHPHGITILLWPKFSPIKLIDIENILDVIIPFVHTSENNQAVCEQCGAEASNFIRDINAHDVTNLCQECNDKLQQALVAQHEELMAITPNYLLATLMGFIYGLGGVALWVLLSSIGFIAGIAGYAIVAGAYFAFKQFGKKVDKNSAVLIVVISVILLFVASYVSTVVYCTIYTDYSFGTLFMNLFSLLTDEGWRILLIDLLIGFALSAFASYQLLRSIFIQAKEFSNTENNQ